MAKNSPANETPKADTPAAPKGFVPKVKRLVTLPVLSLKSGDIAFVKFLSKIEQSKVKQKDKDGKEQDPAHIAQVTMLDTGENRTLICNAVLRSIMLEEYPNDSYIEKGFQIKVADPKAGKRYKGFEVAELEL